MAEFSYRFSFTCFLVCAVWSDSDQTSRLWVSVSWRWSLSAWISSSSHQKDLFMQWCLLIASRRRKIPISADEGAPTDKQLFFLPTIKRTFSPKHLYLKQDFCPPSYDKSVLPEKQLFSESPVFFILGRPWGTTSFWRESSESESNDSLPSRPGVRTERWQATMDPLDADSVDTSIWYVLFSVWNSKFGEEKIAPTSFSGYVDSSSKLHRDMYDDPAHKACWTAVACIY